MASPEQQELETMVREFFEKMGFEVTCDIASSQDQVVPVSLRTDEPKVLIGHNGQTLLEIQHLLRVIARRRLQDVVYLDLDINNYKQKKQEYLKETAQSVADEAVFVKKEKALAPMPAYERRIIHLELARRNDVTTESAGEEQEGTRHVVIRPI